MIAKPVKRKDQPPPPSSNFKPSPYQAAILDWGVRGTGSAVVLATAGSGKTTTAVEFANQVIRSKSAVFLAFNKHIADELSKRMPGMTCKTLHSIGYGALAKALAHKSARINVDDRKYKELADSSAFRLDPQQDQEELESTREALRSLVHFCQCTLVNPMDSSAMDRMAEFYAIDLSATPVRKNFLYEEVAAILREGDRMAQKLRQISYADMLYLPIQWKLPFPRFDWIVVDEAQDLSRAQREIVYRMMHSATRTLAIGDRYQAINGFAGADPRSFDALKEDLSALELPLTYCYRCPRSHIEIAQRFSSAIEPAPGAIEGEISTVKLGKLFDTPGGIQEGDFVLSRRTAPLIQFAISCIAHKIPAKVKGRDIAKGLTKIVKEVAKSDDFKWQDFPNHLHNYREDRIFKLQNLKNSEAAIDRLNDQILGITTIWEESDCKSPAELIEEIENLFSDERSSVTCCTVHRAKGLENDRILILEPGDLPFSHPRMAEWEEEAERNVAFVAYTRSKKTLILVESE